MFEDELPYRRYFLKIQAREDEFPDRILRNMEDFPDAARYKRLCNIHTVVIDSPWWERHIAFRDKLRNDDVTRDKYAELKSRLAQNEWDSVNDYAGAKTDFIRAIERSILSQE